MDDDRLIELAGRIAGLERSIERLQTIEIGSGTWTSWTPITAAATYVSASSFTLVGDHTAYLKLGTKVKLTNSTVKYGYVLSSSYSSPNTTVNLVPNSSYSLASGTITGVNISYANPPDFPVWLNFTSTITGFSDLTSMPLQFKIDGNLLTISTYIISGTSNATTITFTVPVLPAENYLPYIAFVPVRDNGAMSTTPGHIARLTGESVLVAYKSWFGGSFTTSGQKSIWLNTVVNYRI